MGLEEPKSMCLQQNMWHAQFKVSSQENEDLLRYFTAEELDAVLKDAKTENAHVPDGLPILFYKQF
jgi:hypothetical protein